MKFSKNFFIVVQVICDYWYFGSKFSEFNIEIEDDDYTDQELVNNILNYVDRRHTYSEYKIKIKYIIGDQLIIEDIDSKLIENWQYS